MTTVDPLLNGPPNEVASNHFPKVAIYRGHSNCIGLQHKGHYKMNDLFISVCDVVTGWDCNTLSFKGIFFQFPFRLHVLDCSLHVQLNYHATFCKVL